MGPAAQTRPQTALVGEGRYDQLLAYLGMSYAAGLHRDKARKLFDEACQLLLRCGKLTEKRARAYRVLFMALEQGCTYDEADSQAGQAIFESGQLH